MLIILPFTQKELYLKYVKYINFYIFFSFLKLIKNSMVCLDSSIYFLCLSRRRLWCIITGWLVLIVTKIRATNINQFHIIRGRWKLVWLIPVHGRLLLGNAPETFISTLQVATYSTWWSHYLNTCRYRCAWDL